jgi:hypothetical protein
MARIDTVSGGGGLVFANPATGRPYHQEQIQKQHLKTAAVKAKLGSNIGWHTFRRTYRSWLDETGAPMTVQQELNASRLDPDDDERLWTGDNGNQASGKQQGR